MKNREKLSILRKMLRREVIKGTKWKDLSFLQGFFFLDILYLASQCTTMFGVAVNICSQLKSQLLLTEKLKVAAVLYNGDVRINHTYICQFVFILKVFSLCLSLLSNIFLFSFTREKELVCLANVHLVNNPTSTEVQSRERQTRAELQRMNLHVINRLALANNIAVLFATQANTFLPNMPTVSMLARV